MTVRHAIIGCGQVAPNHLDGFRQCVQSEIVWVCDRNPAVLESFMTANGLTCGTLDHREVFADPNVDSVSIAVDHAQHAALTREALLAGKHVLCEKPFVLSLRDANELTALARERGLILAVVAQHRYDPLIKKIHQMIADGKLGRLVTVSAILQCKRLPEYFQKSYWRGTLAGEGGSVLINQGYHVLDVMVWLGGAITQVSALQDTLRLQGVIETEDTFVGALRFESGALGSIAFTSASEARWRTRIDLVGTGGSLHFDIDYPDTLHFSCLSSENEQEMRDFIAHDSQLRDVPPPGKNYYGIAHRYQIAEFVQAVAGQGTISVDGNEATRTLDAVLRLYQSARGF